MENNREENLELFVIKHIIECLNDIEYQCFEGMSKDDFLNVINNKKQFYTCIGIKYAQFLKS